MSQFYINQGANEMSIYSFIAYNLINQDCLVFILDIESITE